jgi:hypothetical protein
MLPSIISKTVSTVLVVTLLSLTVACYGPFNLTRNVYHWNSGIKGSGEVNEKWMKELVFFGMIVIPVYMISALLDAFIFNSIQFWSGDNPVKASDGSDGQLRVVQIGDTTITMTLAKDGNSADVTYSQGGRIMKAARIARIEQGYQLVDQDDRPLYVAEMSADGGVNFVDRDCQLIDRLSGDQLRLGIERFTALRQGNTGSLAADYPH